MVHPPQTISTWDTGMPAETLKFVGAKSCSVPDGFVSSLLRLFATYLLEHQLFASIARSWGSQLMLVINPVCCSADLSDMWIRHYGLCLHSCERVADRMFTQHCRRPTLTDDFRNSLKVKISTGQRPRQWPLVLSCTRVTISNTYQTCFYACTANSMWQEALYFKHSGLLSIGHPEICLKWSKTIHQMSELCVITPLSGDVMWVFC